MRPGLIRFPSPSAEEPSRAELCLIGSYLAGGLSLTRSMAVEQLLLADDGFYRRVSVAIALWAVPNVGRLRVRRRRGVVSVDGDEGHLTRSITNPRAWPVADCIEQMLCAAQADNRAGRTLIRSVRRVRRAGFLTTDEASAIVVRIAHAMRGDLDARAGLLLGVGEPALARFVFEDGDSAEEWGAKQCHILRQRIGTAGRDWSVDYPSWSEEVAPFPRPGVISREPEDVILSEIEERLNDAEEDGLGPDREADDPWATATAQWKRLKAAMVRRRPFDLPVRAAG